MTDKKSQIQGAPIPHEASMALEMKKVIVVLHWEHLSALEIFKDSNYKIGKLTLNPNFVEPWPINVTTLTAFTTLAEKLNDAITLSASKVKGSAKGVTTAVRALNMAAQSIKAMVQIKVNSNILTAVEVCVSAGFDYYIVSGKPARKTGAFRSTEPGVMLVQIAGGGQQQIQISTDGGETFMDLPPVTCASTQVVGLISKKEYWFRGRRVLTKGRYGEWTGWFSEFAP